MEDKKLILHSVHEELGGKLIPFAGYLMPVRYSSDKEEHLAVRNNVGIFDVSHMGEFMIKGTGALDLIQRVTSNDASKLTDGKAQYSCLPNEEGGIVDDLIVYKISDDNYMLVVNASNIQKDWDWISKFNSEGVEMRNVSENYCLFAVQGPNALSALQKITPVNLAEIGFYSFKIGQIGGIDNVIISATGYTGAGGFELYVSQEDAINLWNKVMEAGEELGIKPIGLGARDTLRMEMGYCLYGNDINDSTSPLESGLGWITKFTKKFTNSVYLQEQKEIGTNRKLVAFKMEERGIPRKDYDIVDSEGAKIGIVTSGTMSPSLNIGIGMGYVPNEFKGVGSEIFIAIRAKTLRARVSKLPLI